MGSNIFRTASCPSKHQVAFCLSGQRIVSPNITLYPVWEGEFGASAVRLLCTLSNYFPDTLSVQWEQDNRPVTVAPISRKLQSVEGEKTFSLTSEIKPNMIEWVKGSSFTCKCTHNNVEFQETIHICQFHVNTPPSIHVEIPSFKTVMAAASQVEATCSVSTVFDAKVTWLINGVVSQSNTMNQDRNTTTIVRTLPVSLSQWKLLKQVTCRAEHKCFSTTEKTVAGPVVTTPTVEIRRSLPDLLKGNSAVLVCDVTQLSSSDLYITFQAENVDISDKQYVDLPVAPGLQSISRHFTVPSNHWKKDKRFTCTVNQGFSNSFKSKSFGNIFVDPSVESLATSEDSGSQKLLCTGSGFDPQIQWFSGSQQISSNSDICMSADGRVTVTSQLSISQTEWKTGKVFTCEVSDRSLNKNVRKNISSACSDLITVTLNPPNAKEIFSNNQAELKCVITGQDRTVVDETKITWQTDGENVNSTTGPTKSEGSVYSKTSTMIRSRTEWEKVTNVRCSAVREAMTPISQELTVHKGDGSEPKVTVHILPEEDIGKGESAEVTLVCLVSSPVLQDYYIAWSEGDGRNSSSYTDGINYPPQKTKNGYSVTSVYATIKKNWDAHKMFYCNVWPAGRKQAMNPRGVSKDKGNSYECNK